ncbi:MAG: hypothetical protein ACFFDK_11985 [Promethearchaeota archaeon]
MAIIMKRENVKKISLGFFILSTILIGLCSNSIAASTTYEPAINKGTVMFKVTQYNERLWDKTISRKLDPDDFFGGDSDQVGARSKITIKNVGSYKWDLSDALIFIFDVQSYIDENALNETETLLLLSFLSKDYVDKVYPDKRNVWEALTVKWNFKVGEFDEIPDDKSYILPIFKAPKDYKGLLDDYNDWALNLNATMLYLGIEPFPIINGDDFLWLLITSNIFTIARPFNSYLTTLIEKLNCDDVKIKENTLILDRKGVEDYTVEVTFNDQGILSDLVIKNNQERVIYEISLDNTNMVVLIASGVIAASVAGILTVLIIRRKKFRQ